MRSEPVFYHVAVVNGVSYVFASVEYPVEEPPEELVIGGVRYVMADQNLQAPAFRHGDNA